MNVLLVGESDPPDIEGGEDIWSSCRTLFEPEDVSCETVPPSQLARRLLCGSAVNLVVVDGETNRGWISELLEEVRRRVVAHDAPDLVVVGGHFEEGEARRLFCGGVANWIEGEHVSLLRDHWHWVARRAMVTREVIDRSPTLAWLEDFVGHKFGHLDVSDGRLNVRFPIVGGRLGPCHVRQFDTRFSKAVAGALNRPASSAPACLGAAMDWRSWLIEGGMWERAVLRDAWEHHQRAAFRWLVGACIEQFRWTSGPVRVPADFTWDIGGLIGEPESSPQNMVRWDLRQPHTRVANDTTFAEVS